MIVAAPSRGSAVAFIGALLLAGCGGGAHHARPAPHHSLTGANASTTNASTRAAAHSLGARANRAAASARVQFLLSHAPTPPGARATTAPSAGNGTVLTGPTMGTTGGTQVVHATSYWRVPLTSSESITWLQAHPLAGSEMEGTSSVGSPGLPTDLGISFSTKLDPVAPQNQPAELQFGAAAAGARSSIWRIDATDVWYDPTPVRDTRGGATIRLTLAGGCPTSLGTAADVSNSGPDRSSALLPVGVPTAGLVCRYRGLSGPDAKPSSERVLDAAQAAKLAAQVGQLRVGSFGMGEIHCPADFGSTTVIALRYPSGEADLWWHDSGCPSVDNGSIQASGSLTL